MLTTFQVNREVRLILTHQNIEQGIERKRLMKGFMSHSYFIIGHSLLDILRFIRPVMNLTQASDHLHFTTV